VPQRWQGISWTRTKRAVVKERGERGHGSVVNHLVGGEGMWLPGHRYMNLPPVTSATVPVMYDDKSLA
jgi:hypothetical protein